MQRPGQVCYISDEAAMGTFLPGLWFSKIESSCWQSSKLVKIQPSCWILSWSHSLRKFSLYQNCAKRTVCVCLPGRELCSQLMNIPHWVIHIKFEIILWLMTLTPHPLCARRAPSSGNNHKHPHRFTSHFLLLLLLLSHFSRVRLCRPCRRQPTRLRRPWDSPGKNTGVGCNCLLQCRKVKSGRSRSVVSDS